MMNRKLLILDLDETFIFAAKSPLGNPKDTRFREWMLPADRVLLLIPFFLMSWWIEAPIAAWILGDVPAQFVDSAVCDANLVTYGLLAALLSACS